MKRKLEDFYDGTPKTNEKLTFKLSKNLKNVVQKESHKRGVSVDRLVRWSINSFLS